MTTEPTQPRGITPSQTVGPFFAYALTPSGQYAFDDLSSNDLVVPGVAGQVVHIEGTMRDGAGAPIADGFIEIWQADGEGRYPSASTGNTGFRGFGRVPMDKAGAYSFRTVKPGAVPAADGGVQAPHILIGVFARGVVRRLYTRLYFADDAGNAADPVLALVPEADRGTLIAGRAGERDGAPVYRFDIVLQGEGETVFFEA